MLVALVAILYVVARYRSVHSLGGLASDVDILWLGARSLLDGRNPYHEVGPGLPFPYAFGLYYPLTAIALFVPAVAAGLPLAAVGPLFDGLSAGLLAWALSKDRRSWTPLIALASGGALAAFLVTQWSPLLTAVTLLGSPWIAGILFTAKPTIGAALWCYRLDWRAAAAGVAFTLATVAAVPEWPASWRAILAPAGSFLSAPVLQLHGAGLVVLLGLRRWRRPEARVLVALACVPQTLLAYELVPLCALVPQTRREFLVLAILSAGPLLLQIRLVHAVSFDAQVRLVGGAMVACTYLPALVMVLRRPNDGALPAWVAALASRASLAALRQRAATGGS